MGRTAGSIQPGNSCARSDLALAFPELDTVARTAASAEHRDEGGATCAAVVADGTARPLAAIQASDQTAVDRRARFPALWSTRTIATPRRSHWPCAETATMKQVPSENQLHASVAEFLDWALLPPALYTTFPAGWGRLGKATSGWLKKCGLKEGMPDILIFYDKRCVGIELKVGNNKQTQVQRDMTFKLARAGVPVYVATSIEAVEFILRHELLPMREIHVGGKSWHAEEGPAAGGWS